MHPRKSKSFESGQSAFHKLTMRLHLFDITLAKLNFTVTKRSNKHSSKSKEQSFTKVADISNNNIPVINSNYTNAATTVPKGVADVVRKKLPDIIQIETLNDIAVTYLIRPEDDGRPNLVISKYESLYNQMIENLNGHQFSKLKSVPHTAYSNMFFL